MAEQRRGIRTTEFWVTLGAMLLGVLVASGIVTPDVADTVEGRLGEIADAVSKLGAALIPIVYVVCRTKVKMKGK